MKRLSFIEIQWRIASFQRTLENVLIAEEFYCLTREIGLEKQEVKMGFRISVRDVKRRQERRVNVVDARGQLLLP
jgi:hypothetical protein